MDIPEYRISPALQAALAEAFTPFLRIEVGGQRLVDRVQTDEDLSPLPAPLRIQLAHTLENTLALRGGGEGIALLEAMDGMLNESGAPAFVMRGLTNGRKTGLSTLIAEAFHQLMVPQGARHGQHLYLGDMYLPWLPTRYGRAGTTTFHHDPSDYNIIYCEKPGINPRPTLMIDAQDLVEHCVKKAQTLKEFSPAEIAQLKEHFQQLFQLPIWPMPQKKNKENTPIVFKPIFYSNPHYTQQPGSVPYRFVTVPFREIQQRAVDFSQLDIPAIPAELKEAAALLAPAFSQMVTSEKDYPAGVLLNKGDFLTYNNHLVMHAGGPFIHPHLPLFSRLDPRYLKAIDINAGGNPYPGEPGDHWRKAILLETGTPRINNTVPANGRASRSP